MRIARFFTARTNDPYQGLRWRDMTPVYGEPDEDAGITWTVPDDWSPAAAELLMRRFACQEDIPALLRAEREDGVPSFLLPRTADNERLSKLPPEQRHTREHDARQVFDRIAGSLTYEGWKAGLFDNDSDASAFYDEIRYMMVRRMAAPEDGIWQTLGVHWAYGMDEPYQQFLHAIATPDTAADSGFGPRGSAANITGLGNAMGGAGSNGLMNWLKLTDRFLSIRAANGMDDSIRPLAIVDASHPETRDFASWWRREEEKAAALSAGSHIMRRRLGNIMSACHPEDDNGCDPRHNTQLAHAIFDAREDGIAEQTIDQAIRRAMSGQTAPDVSDFHTGWDGPAWDTVSARHINGAVRMPDSLVDAARSNADWVFCDPETNMPVSRMNAAQLWSELAENAWTSSCPALQFDTAIQAWNTCPNSGRIQASSSDSALMFLDGSFAPQATIDLMAFSADAEDDTDIVQLRAYTHACKLWTVALDLIADHHADDNTYRALGLGFANLSTLLMAHGIAYDSDAGRAIASALSGLMTGAGYVTSAEMARDTAPFPAFADNRIEMLRVMRYHRLAARGETQGYDTLARTPALFNADACPDGNLAVAAQAVWKRVQELGGKHGFRNAQISFIANAGLSGALMELQAHGLDPVTELVRFDNNLPDDDMEFAPCITRNLVPAVRSGLRRLGLRPRQIGEITEYALGHMSLREAPAINHATLRERGFTKAQLDAVEDALEGAVDIRYAFNKWVLGEDFCRHVLNLTHDQLDSPAFDMLPALGFTEQDIARANAWCCGAMTLEGAPHLEPHQAKVFDTALPGGRSGAHHVDAQAQVAMMGAVQSFISGGIGRVMHATAQTRAADIADAFGTAWASGIKGLSIYRDGASLTRPVHSGLDLPGTEELARIAANDQPAPQHPAVAAEQPAHVAESFVQAADEVAHKHATQPRRHDVDGPRPQSATRQTLPGRRKGYTQKARVGGHKVYLRTGEYTDGSLGEIFIDMHKEGTAFRSLLNNFAISVSIALQYGVPLEEFVEAFTFTRFEPAGRVEGNGAVKLSTSVLDYVFRELAISYMGRADLADVEPGDLAHDGVSRPEDEGLPMEGTEAGKAVSDALDRIVSSGYMRRPFHALPGKDGHLPRVPDDAMISAAREDGYTGTPCAQCGSMTVLDMGDVTACDTCHCVAETRAPETGALETQTESGDISGDLFTSAE